MHAPSKRLAAHLYASLLFGHTQETLPYKWVPLDNLHSDLWPCSSECRLSEHQLQVTWVPNDRMPMGALLTCPQACSTRSSKDLETV